MRYAIIAAGEGLRLREEGILTPKPLIRVRGEALIDRLIRIFMDNDAEEIIVICNDLYPEVAEHLTELEQQGLPLRHVVKTTESSMHSLYEIAPMLRGAPFILTTVDTYFDEQQFAEYVKAFQESGADGLLGVTDYCDDERPLYVVTEQNVWISAGIYGLRDNSLDTLERCIREGQSRMRNFQRALLTDGLQVLAYPLGKVMDIDHVSDIEKLKGSRDEGFKLLGIYRAERFSPGSVEKDRAILDATLDALRKEGYSVETITEEKLLSTSPLPPPYLLSTSPIIISMARSEEALRMLEGRPCINDPEAVRICNRRLYITDTTDEPPLWVKRTDQCREQEGDVVFCPDRDALDKAVANLKARGITEYVCQRHYEGEHVKFYGIDPHSPIGLRVYGGDAIIEDNGTVHIVDLNDFPSFSACKKEAANEIAKVATLNI